MTVARRALAGLALAGCAELRVPPAVAPPAGLGAAGAAQPWRAILALAAADFADAGAGLAGQPARAARGIARVEWLAAIAPRQPAWPTGVTADLALARIELRETLGLAPGAPGEATITALLAAATALEASDPGRAARALPGGAGQVARLGVLGPLPQAANATARAAATLAQIDTEAGWVVQARPSADPFAVTTPGLGGGF